MARKQARFGQPAVYNATPPTLTDGEDSALSVDANQNLRVTSGGSGATADQVQGAGASGATKVGNPVLVGGVNNTTLPTLTNGQTGDVQLGTRGSVHATLMVANSTASIETVATNVDAVAAGSVGTRLQTASLGYVFNGTTWDRLRGSGTAFIAPLNDVDISVKASAGSLLSVSATNINAAIRYLQVFNKATAPAGGDTAVFSFPIPAGSSTVPAVVSVARDFLGQNGHQFSTGIAVGVSTTAATFTAATTTDHVVNGTYL